ncbi:MAG: hypothetical protein ABI742_06415 [Gemmatimonadota bacterium]
MRRGRILPRFPRWIGAVCALSSLAGMGCETRDRLTFPSSGPSGAGPHTVIDRPLGDVTVSGDSAIFFVTGYSIDPDGLDSIYFETVGGLTTFQPEVVSVDSLRFGLPLTTLGLAGDTILLRVFATDQLGNRGDTAIRRFVVQ